MADPRAEMPAAPLQRRARRTRSKRPGRTAGSADGHVPTRRTPSATSPTGSTEVAGRPKLYVLDMFPYPSGAGLHVGHPLGYIGTDVYARYLRMTGHNVLHTMGYDAFGLPAEQYAVQTGQHPRVTTEANIANMRRQLRALGLGHDPRRGVATTDVDYYRWTQWIFLQIFDSWYDADADRARPIAELIAELEPGAREPDERHEPRRPPVGRARRPTERRAVVDAHRLAYLDEAPVNWCPGLGTVLANEEVTADGRSERGNFPVFRRAAEAVDAAHHRVRRPPDRRPRPARLARVDQAACSATGSAAATAPSVTFPVVDHERTPTIEVFTTRPDTLFGATYMVLAPEHPLVDELTADAVAADLAPTRAGVDRRARHAGRGRRGVPAPGRRQERARAPGRGPGQDRRLHRRLRDQPRQRRADPGLHRRLRADGLRHRGDHGRARPGPARLGVRRGVRPADRPHRAAARRVATGEAFVGEGPADQQRQRRGRPRRPGRRRGQAPPSSTGSRPRAPATGTVTYKLRDWLFSRQRYWGEPFPIVYDEDGLPRAVPDSMLPVVLPDVDDYSPATFADDDETRCPSRRSARATDWVEVELDLGEGPKVYRRETNTMPQWAGSCWYELRYLDPTNEHALRRPRDRAVLDGPAVRGRLRRRRPVRRRRRARRAAPALRPVLAQGAVRPGPRVVARAVPPPVQPGHDPGRAPTPTTAASTSRPPRSTSATAASATATAGQPRVRQDGQEPEERGHARRHVRELRRRHAAALRDVHRPARPEPAVGAPRPSSACTGCCSGSGATSSTRTPATPRVTDDARRRRDHAASAAPHDRRGARRHGDAALQHLDRPHHRAQQPPHRARTPTVACRARWPSRWC